MDALFASNPDRVDPYLFTAMTRLKNAGDVEGVKERIHSTFAGFKDQLVSQKRLEDVKRHLRYSFLLSMDNSETIARGVAQYVALRRTPETINRVYERYDEITPEDIREVARKYFVENGRTIVTLSGSKGK